MDCREGLAKLDSDSIDCCISSPPYWSLRDYGIEPTIWDSDPNCEHDFDIKKKKCGGGHSGGVETSGLFTKEQAIRRKEGTGSGNIIKEGFCSKCGAWKGALGLEPNFELFIKHLCDIYDLVWRVLKPTGTCWVNLGDTYASGIKGSGGMNSSKVKIKGKENFQSFKPIKVNCSVPDKCLTMIPQRFALEMINRGWILRNVIIWQKPNCMPSSAKDRFTVDFEYVYFFVKSNKTQYWINEKTRKSMSTKPLGIKGIEGIDWEWRECEKCLGTGIKHKKCKFCVETGWYYDEFLRPRKCPKCRGLGRIKMDSKCESCKGKGIKKYNFWKGRQYFFEQQREGLSQNPATRERYKYKVGNQTNRKDNGVGMVKPGKAFSEHFPQDLPQENDFPILKYTEKDLDNIEKNKNPNIIYSRNSVKGGVQESNNPRQRWGYTQEELKKITKQKSGWEKEREKGINNREKYQQREWNEYMADVPLTPHPLGKNKRTVWKIPTKASPETHFATFPPDLVKPMILSGCPEFICKECGMPREKIYDVNYLTINQLPKEHPAYRPNHPHQVGKKRQNVADPNVKKMPGEYKHGRAYKQSTMKGYYDCGCSGGYDSKYKESEYGQTLQGFVRNNSIKKDRDQSRIDAKKLFPNDIKKQKEHIKNIHDHDTGKPKKIVGLTNCNHGQQWKPGIVLDPFAGIGTTLLTAWNLGRNYIGFEISKEYCKIANKKLDITNYIRLDDFIEEKIVA